MCVIQVMELGDIPKAKNHNRSRVLSRCQFFRDFFHSLDELLSCLVVPNEADLLNCENENHMF